MQQCVFERIKGLKEIQRKYEGKVDSIEVVDFRELTTNIENGIQKKTINPNADGTIINLGKNSEFFGESDTTLSKMRVTDYDPRIMPKHHMGDIQEYYVSNYVLQSDVIINMPKPKTHRKAGVTISLKKLCRYNTRKGILPRHTFLVFKGWWR